MTKTKLSVLCFEDNSFSSQWVMEKSLDCRDTFKKSAFSSELGSAI